MDNENDDNKDYYDLKDDHENNHKDNHKNNYFPFSENNKKKKEDKNIVLVLISV